MTKANAHAVKILDKDYQVACPPGEEDGLNRAAALLDKQMRDIRLSGKVMGTERIAVMAALNMSHELLQMQRKLNDGSQTSNDGLKRLNSKIEDALHRLRQLEIG